MTKQTKAQRLADELDDWSEGPNTWELTSKAAALLRRQDELLEQALQALNAAYNWQATTPILNSTIATIRAHREAK